MFNIKKCFVLCFLLLSCLNLAAQTFSDIRIFVPPVVGEGEQGDSMFFYRQLTYEVILQHHSLVRTQRNSDYTLRGLITCEPEQIIEKLLQSGNNYDSLLGNRNNVFFLEMIESTTDRVIAQQYITYTILDFTVENMISAMVYNMLSGIPNVKQIDNWRNKWLFFEGSALWSPRLYHRENESINWFNFGLRLALDFHFLNFFSFDTGLQFIQDWVVISRTNNIEYRDLVLEIPAALKLTLKPSHYFMLQPYGGFSYNYSLMGQTQPSPLSWFAGFQLGLNTGPGMMVIDPRFSMDLGDSHVNDMSYQRYMLQIGIGYKIGFFSKRVRTRDY